MTYQDRKTEFAEDLERKLYAQQVVDQLSPDRKAELFRQIAKDLQSEIDNTSYSSDTKDQARELVSQVKDVF